MSELPKGWVEAMVREVVQPTETCDPTRDGGEEFRYVDIGSINNKTYTIEAPKTLLGREAPSRAKRRIRRGDVLFSTVRTYLKNIALVPDELDGEVTSTGIAVLRPSEAILSSFLFSTVRSDSFIRSLSLKQDGTLYPAITDSDLLNHRISIPPLAEQKRIVAKLDALNTKSARARTELARIETLVSRYKQAVLSKAFSGELTREWRKKQASNTGWSKAVISDIAEVITGSTPKTAEKDRFFGGDTPFFKPTDLDQGYYVDTPRQTLSAAGVAVSRLVPAHSVLVTCIGATIGKVGFARVACCTNQQINALIPNIDLAKPEWLYWMVSCPEFQATILANSSATTLPIINKGRFQQLPLDLPPLAEQQEIVRRIEAAFARIDRLAAEARRALELVGKLDEAILAKAFRGELVPQDDNDEPASLLLDRIREARMGKPSQPKRRASATKGKVLDMARTIIEALAEAKDWIAAHELFARCGVRDGSSTEDVEKLYRQLLDLERQDRVEIEEVSDSLTGAKLGNRVRLRK